MMPYTYNPENIREPGKDRMRFELGDTMTEGQADTTALSDEEIQAAIEMYPGRWKRAKLALLESLCRRFAYEVDTKTGPLWLYMQERAKLWRADYECLKKKYLPVHAVYPGLGRRQTASRLIFIQACSVMEGQAAYEKHKDDVHEAWQSF